MKASIKLQPVTALYIRTSTDKQDTGADMQLNELTKFIIIQYLKLSSHRL